MNGSEQISNCYIRDVSPQFHASYIFLTALVFGFTLLLQIVCPSGHAPPLQSYGWHFLLTYTDIESDRIEDMFRYPRIPTRTKGS